MSDVAWKLSDELCAGLGRPIVALESSVVAHGLPWPENLETALEVEAAVRSEGAIPATLAIIDGKVRVGLDRAGLEHLARSPGILKASPRDVPWLISQRRTGATTVAGTIMLAEPAGIPIMATGGIGGVHHGATESWDVSADLIELSRTRVAVVCSGAKSILDLPRTLELLETLGVPVIGYGVREFPAFFARSSGLPLEASVNSPAEGASLIRRGQELGPRAGVLIVNPVPAEHALSREEMDRLVDVASRAAEAAGLRGKAVTPFLLEQIRSQSDGRALTANRALLINNARLAAQIAVELAKLRP